MLFLVLALLNLWPLLQADWFNSSADWDEGVHLLATRQFVLGYAPYKDFFFAQPPATIYGLVPAAALGNGGIETVWLGRFTSVLWNLGTLYFIYLTGRILYGWIGGVIALAVLGLDGWQILIGRQVMMECQLNFFSVLALWAFLQAIRPQPLKPLNPKTVRAWLMLSGFAAASACLTKLIGLLLPLVLIFYLLAGRRWAQLAVFMLTFIAALLLLVLPLALTAPDEFFKQLILFQLIRGADGITGANRLAVIFLNPKALLTVLSAVFSLLGILLNRKFGQKFPFGLPVVLLWLALGLGYYFSSRVIYPHYYLSLLPALSLLAGGLPGLFTALSHLKRPLLRQTTKVVLSLGIVLTLFSNVVTYSNGGSSPQLMKLGNLIQTHSPANATLFALDGLDNFFGARPAPANHNGKYLVDWYGTFFYQVYGLTKVSVWQGLELALFHPDRNEVSLYPILENITIQSWLEDLNQQADYTLIKAEGQPLINPALRPHWLLHSQLLIDTPQFWFYANRRNNQDSKEIK